MTQHIIGVSETQGIPGGDQGQHLVALSITPARSPLSHRCSPRIPGSFFPPHGVPDQLLSEMQLPTAASCIRYRRRAVSRAVADTSGERILFTLSRCGQTRVIVSNASAPSMETAHHARSRLSHGAIHSYIPVSQSVSHSLTHSFGRPLLSWGEKLGRMVSEFLSLAEMPHIYPSLGVMTAVNTTGDCFLVPLRSLIHVPRTERTSRSQNRPLSTHPEVRSA